jgi:tRNA threonylcarbamoyl adenosine modification protein YeaZ
VNTLAIDTATEQFSLALASNGSAWLFEADAGLRHSELIMGGIETLLKTAGLKQNDLNGVVCTGGPGSFTGLRIGFSVAKGLALALGIPFCPIPTLDCMARPLSFWPGLAVPVIDAKQKAFFCALFHNGKRLGHDMDASPAAIASAIVQAIAEAAEGAAATGGEKALQTPTLLFGPGAELLAEKLSTAETGPVITPGRGIRYGSARTLLQIAEETDIFANNALNFSTGPEYIRKGSY